MATFKESKILNPENNSGNNGNNDSTTTTTITTDSIIKLNVGGRKFSTTKNTLLSIPDTFFTVLLSNRIPSLKDESGAYFLDRDPDLFAIILNYLRTQRLTTQIDEKNFESIKHEAEYYGIRPLVEKFKFFKNFLENPTCSGNIVFQSLVKTNMNTKVNQIIPYDSGLVLIFDFQIKCYRLTDYDGWQCCFQLKFLKEQQLNNKIKLVAFHLESLCSMCFLLAICFENIFEIKMLRGYFSFNNNTTTKSLHNSTTNAAAAASAFGIANFMKLNGNNYEEIAKFTLKDVPVDSMFFIGSQLVALNQRNAQVGIWNNSRWFVQNMKQKNNVKIITAFDKAESDYLFLCSNNGGIFLIDMQKFPLRLKDGDLLINEFFKDPEMEEITAISCYHCSALTNEYYSFGIEKSIEIAYGTKQGTVRVLGHHPETVGQGPTLFQTVQVHLSPITKIMLNNEYLITICNKLHVRTWSLVRFRGLISTQPGTKSYASYKIFYFDEQKPEQSDSEPSEEANEESEDLNQNQNNLPNIGPFGYQREGDRQILIELLKKFNNKSINILYAANGQKICKIKSIDDSPITCFSNTYKHDTRYGQYIVTGHQNGNIQIWDLTTAQELQPKDNSSLISSWKLDKLDLIKNLFNND